MRWRIWNSAGARPANHDRRSILPEGLDPDDIILEQHELVEKLIGRQAMTTRVFWYYTPMALAFSSDLECDLCVYDNMDELSLFRGASQR